MKVTYGDLKRRKTELQNKAANERILYGEAKCDTLTELAVVSDRLRITEKGWLRKVVKLLIVLGVGLSLSGCLESTMTGLGRFVEGGGEFVSGVGKDIQRGSEGYASKR